MREEPTSELDEGLRLSWSRSQGAVARRLVQPLQSFLEAEASSAVLLLSAAALAIAWANSPWSAAYEDLWRTVLTLRIGDLVLREDLRHWVNEGLMSLFFLVVGLEIKRELLTGELRERRRALLPVVAAVAGMAVPALVYLAVAGGTVASEGWAVAMPTDLAFALGVLALSLPRAPVGLKVFLLTLAIVDDIGSILVVALVYSGVVGWGWLAIAAALGLAIAALQRIHVRFAAIYVCLGIAIWLAVREAGISPTLAGVALGLLTPAVPFQRPRAVSEEAHRIADATVDDPSPPDADAPQWLRLASLTREAVSPLARVEAALHPWTSYVVVPIFALANAGVVLSASALEVPAGGRLAVAVVVARIVGKPLGIVLGCLLAIRLGLATRPSGSSWLQVVGVGACAGIPFTVAIFVAELALPSGLRPSATIGIFAAAVIAGAIAFVVLRATRPSTTTAGPSLPGEISAGRGG
jgi:Na+:H+ antiporter, NhaA family